MKAALTFDAELPGRVHAGVRTPWEIRAILAVRNVPATWFMQGRWCRLEPRVAQWIAEAGHLIGNHSMFHAPLTMLSAQGIRDDIALAEQEIEKATGVSPKPWFRAPNLALSAQVEEAISDAGYWHVGADVFPLDYEPSVSADELTERVVEGVLHDGPVVLLHSWPRTTAEALPRILDRLDSKIEWVTVADL